MLQSSAAVYGLDKMKSGITYEKYESNLASDNSGRFHFYKSKILKEHEQIMPESIQLMKRVVENIGATMSEVFGHNVLSDDTASDENQLKAQLIRHQLAAPMKIIQLLLSLSMSKSLDFEGNNLSSKVIEHFLYKPRFISQVNSCFVL